MQKTRSEAVTSNDEDISKRGSASAGPNDVRRAVSDGHDLGAAGGDGHRVAVVASRQTQGGAGDARAKTSPRCKALDADRCRCLARDGHGGPHDFSYTPYGEALVARIARAKAGRP